MKTDPDVKRFLRYQSVIDVLYTKNSFYKPEIYKAFETEKPHFMGRVIKELMIDGYLINSGAKTNPQYLWSNKKKEFNSGRWIDQRVFTPTVKRSPSVDRPRARLLRLGPSALKI